jgi:DNA polymerase III sliding clamp (beta) subunit (PCNA family)
MKTVLRIEGKGTQVFEGDCSVKEAMNLAGLTRSEWKIEKTKESATKIEYAITPKPVIAKMPPVQLYQSHPASPPTPETDEIEEETDEQSLDSIAPAPQMEFTITIPRDELQAVLQVIIDIIPKQMMLPALSKVKIVSTEDSIALSATDLEQSFSVSIPATGTPAAFLVDASLLAREVKALHKSIEDVVLTASGDMVHINDRCSLHVSDVEEFPALPEVTGEAVSISNLTAALRAVLPAVNLDQTRYTLTGVYFDFARGKVVATDGIRLHMEDIAVIDTPACLVPRPAAVMLHKYQATEITISEKHFSAPLMGGTFTARFMEGKFPDYAGIVEGIKNEHTAKFQADEFLALVPGVLPVSESAAIDMTINGRIDIDAESSAGSYKWHVPATSNLIDGAIKHIRINCKYIMDAIKAYADSETITMTFPDAYGAITINEKAVIMPIRQ